MNALLRRLGLYAVAAWAALTLDFVLPRMMPGDPTAAMFARFQGKLQPEAMAALRATFGVTDAPVWRQYLDHLGHLARGDLGTSLAKMTEKLRADEDSLRGKVEALERATQDLAQAQARLVRSERLASVGRLAAGVAHEIGNPLAAILGLVELVRQGDLEPAEHAEFLRRIQN